VAYEQRMGLAGAFIYSADMDTTDYQVSVTGFGVTGLA
jgi:hypothetical protein